ncbi:unnamed protein product [Rhizopus stolonifer]
MSAIKEMSNTVAAYASQEPHPLDQLKSEEIIQVSAIIRQAKPEIDLIFNSITLKEPAKNFMLSYLGWDTTKPRSTSVEREAFVIILNKKTVECFEAVVSLTQSKLTSWTFVPDVQPGMNINNAIEVERLVLENDQIREECLELGITDMSCVFADAWPIARHIDYPDRKKRLMQAFMYMRTCENDNQYAHPLDFVPVIDIGKMEIIAIERIKPRNSKFDRPTIPQENHNFLPEFIGEENFRKDVKPIIVQQPQGVSFTVTGNEIDWQKWNMRISMNYREGLVIHNVSYQDGQEKRPLFYRISLSEMLVPYADPQSPHYRKQAFDVGECGLGICTNSLSLGCDCLGSIYYFDAIFSDHKGRPFNVPNAVCLHEEDYGLLFKHTDFRTGRAHTVRSRRLVVSQIVTVANYDYGLYYYFYQDGTFEYEVKATGELNTHVLAKDETPEGYGVIVAPQINAQHHQHFFTMRIDPMIDGVKNSVASVDVEPVPYPTGHPNNVYGNAFKPRTTILRDTIEGQQSVNYDSSRFWKILNENRLHPYTNEPVSWKVVSKSTARLFARDDSVAAERAGFAKRALYVTPYNEDQIFAGGFYANMSSGEDTVEHWAKTGDDIANKDIVLWFTFGLTHLPRVEDFPIMPVEMCGFSMKPCNFFMANPGLDVPPTNKNINYSVNAKEEVSDKSCCASKI